MCWVGFRGEWDDRGREKNFADTFVSNDNSIRSLRVLHLIATVNIVVPLIYLIIDHSTLVHYFCLERESDSSDQVN